MLVLQPEFCDEDKRRGVCRVPPRMPACGAGRAGERAVAGICDRPNGQRAKLRGQGPRGYGSAARRMPAFEVRDAGGVTPRKLR
jgi:hypothetical protein